MKKNLFFSLFLCVSIASILAQTSAIAHKSHSGSPSTMPTKEWESFGIPPSKLVKIIWLDAETVIEVSEDWKKRPTMDTIKHHEIFCNPDLSIQDLKAKYPHIKFQRVKNKDKSPKSSSSPKDLGEIKSALEQSENTSLPIPFAGIGVIVCLCAAAALAHARFQQNDTHAG